MKKKGIGGLILYRRPGEKVIINNGELEIEVVETKQGSVRLAFRASREVKIQRGEAVENEKDPANQG